MGSCSGISGILCSPKTKNRENTGISSGLKCGNPVNIIDSSVKKFGNKEHTYN